MTGRHLCGQISKGQHAAVTPCNQNFIERIPEWVYNLGAVQ